MATSVALRRATTWRATTSPLFAKLTNPVRSVFVFRSFNTDSQSQVANTGGNAPGDYGRVELDRRSSSDRSPARRGDTTPSFFSGEMKNGVLKLMVPKVKEEERKNVHEVKIE